jgi:transcriptional regulator with XRE-family HTH domain
MSENYDLIDVYVGARLRFKRMQIALSQKDLGKKTGVTFQQIQKYEKGINRIGASRLYDFAKILKVPVSYFFEGFDEKSDAILGDNKKTFNDKEIFNLVRAFSKIKDSNIRKSVIALAKSLALKNSEKMIKKEDN